MFKCTQSEFIEKAIEIHGEKYDYSLVEYTGQKNKIKIVCPVHGLFEQEAKSHLKKNGCSRCKTKSKDNFILEAKKIHGDFYDYDLVEYKNSYTKVKIVCGLHGVFEQVPYAHLRKQGCKKCHFDGRIIGLEDFIARSKEIHGEKYNYDCVDYVNCKQKVKILCPEHGYFLQIADDHQRGIGCSKCKASHGERAIRSYLQLKSINFVEQSKFETCKNIRPLPFDFYLQDYDILIEFQGEHHFEPKTKNRMFGANNPYEEYLKIKHNDDIKSRWCEENDKKLILINYKDINKLEKILDDKIK